MNMKKTVSAVLTIVILAFVGVAGSSIYFTGNDNRQHVVDFAKLLQYETAQDVIEHSSLVVRAVKNREEPALFDGVLNSTLSNVTITNIVKNDQHNHVEGDAIDVLESEWTDSEGVVHHLMHYKNMSVGNEYLLLLGYNESVNNYYPTGLQYGKVPVNVEEQVFWDGFSNEQVSNVINELRGHIGDF